MKVLIRSLCSFTTPRSPGVRRLLTAAFLPLLVLLFLPAYPMQAQERPAEDTPPTVDLHGQVLDADSGEPIHRASVYLPQRNIGFVTLSDGSFLISDLQVGAHTVSVERLGYVPMDVQLTVTTDGEPTVFRLLPDPVLLEGIEVVLDRFEHRRRATPTSVQVYREEELWTTSFSSVRDFLSVRSHARFHQCPAHFLQFDCVLTRGRLQSARVYIDESPAIGGLDHLASYAPQDFRMVEVYARGRHIRAYTHQFMERAARIRLTPVPLHF